MHIGVSWGERNYLENLEVDGKITKMGHQEVKWGIDWIDVAQDRYMWHALVNALTKVRIQSNVGDGNFFTS
jgi:hypothetical protein